ncbi:MAG: ribonuclease P protein component [Alcanivoracaceae bacterium]|nr:ribonuclease P protein component [Alcanivoracaceae bacterium]
MADLSFTRHHRLLTPAAFKTVFDHADYRAGGAHVLLLARENGGLPARLGLVVGKRRVRHAVARNRIKRHGRESFRLRCQALSGLDVVLLVKSPWPRPAPAELNTELARLWDKLLAKRGQA